MPQSLTLEHQKMANALINFGVKMIFFKVDNSRDLCPPKHLHRASLASLVCLVVLFVLVVLVVLIVLVVLLVLVVLSRASNSSSRSSSRQMKRQLLTLPLLGLFVAIFLMGTTTAAPCLFLFSTSTGASW